MATRDLLYGMRGDDVKTLQSNLNSLGYNCGPVDGIFGLQTFNGVMAFQRACGIAVDGWVGPVTRAALEGKLKAKAPVVVQKAQKPYTPSVTVETGRWNGHKFTVSPTLIYSFNKLKIKGSSELLGKDDSEQGYVSRKGANPMEVTFNVVLNAHTGCNVRQEAMNFIAEANNGDRDYFYVGLQKLVAPLLMLTDATVDEIETTREGKWIRAAVSLTMKQCQSYDCVASSNSGSTSGGSSGSSGGGGYSGGGGGGSTWYSNGSNKVSVRNTTPVKTISNQEMAKKIGTTGSTVIGDAMRKYGAVKKGTSIVKQTSSTAKAASSSKVRTTVVSSSNRRMSGMTK